MAHKSDWSATQYLKFLDERTRPARELLAQVPMASPERIVDLGCGPGNSTAVLVERYPAAQVLGMDSSTDMIAKAKAALPDIEFEISDLRTYEPTPGVDLFFSNAVFQWLSSSDRIRIITRLLRSQTVGGTVAFQVPDNLMEPCHVAMREIAEQPDAPWRAALQQSPPNRDTFQTPQELYDALTPLCSHLNIWYTIYHHVLESHEAIVEWVKGTGLRPFIDPLSADQQAAFLQAYLERLTTLYPTQTDGKVLLRYPRLFVVAVRS